MNSIASTQSIRSIEKSLDSPSKNRNCRLDVPHHGEDPFLENFLNHRCFILSSSTSIVFSGWRNSWDDQQIYFSEDHCDFCSAIGQSNLNILENMTLSQLRVYRSFDGASSTKKSINFVDKIWSRFSWENHQVLLSHFCGSPGILLDSLNDLWVGTIRYTNRSITIHRIKAADHCLEPQHLWLPRTTPSVMSTVSPRYRSIAIWRIYFEFLPGQYAPIRWSANPLHFGDSSPKYRKTVDFRWSEIHGETNQTTVIARAYSHSLYPTWPPECPPHPIHSAILKLIKKRLPQRDAIRLTSSM